MTKNTSLVQVGVITSAHGIRGEVKIRSYTRNPKDILKCKPLTDASGKRSFTLALQGMQKDTLIVSIEGIATRNDAEVLKNIALYTQASQLSEKDSFQNDIIGMEVRLADGSAFGTVIGLYNFGAGDILDINKVDGKSEMYPFNSAVFPKIDMDTGIAIIDPPEVIG